jgi:hypothetical protein
MSGKVCVEDACTSHLPAMACVTSSTVATVQLAARNVCTPRPSALQGMGLDIQLYSLLPLWCGVVRGYSGAAVGARKITNESGPNILNTCNRVRARLRAARITDNYVAYGPAVSRRRQPARGYALQSCDLAQLATWRLDSARRHNLYIKCCTQ